MQGGGADREWYASMNPDGNRDLDILDESIGCHVGPYAGLNVANPQPGFEYRWGLNNPREILRAKIQGSQVVQAEDPEYAAYHALNDSDQTPLDTSDLYNELVLLRTPIEKVRERRAEERRKAEESVRGSVDAFVDRASPLEADVGRRRGQPTRFARSDHMLEYDEDGRVDQVWTPGSGIVRR